MNISPISPLSLFSPSSPPTPYQGGGGLSIYSGSSSSHSERLFFNEQLQRNITLTTSEGDRVTLSYRENTTLLAESYSGKARLDQFQQGAGRKDLRHQEMEYQEQFLAFEHEEGIAIEIDGELNQEEIDDIRTALDKIDELMQNLLDGGDLYDGIEVVQKIAGLENIASASADYHRQRSLLVAATTRELEFAGYNRFGELANNPMADPLNSAPNITAPNEPDIIPTAIDSESDPAAQMAAIIAELVQEKKIDPDHFLDPVERLFQRRIADLSEAEDNHTEPRPQLAQRIEKIGQQLIQQIQEMSRSFDHKSEPDSLR